MTRKSLFPMLAMACLSVPASLLAQFETATVLGTVRDSSAALMPAVKVVLKNVETGIAASTQTDSKGDYQFPNVKIGTYQVTAEHPGFSTALVQNIVVTVNARQRADIILQVGAVGDKVVVNGAVALLET